MALYHVKELVVHENTRATKSGAVSVLFTRVYSVPVTVPASERKRLSKYLLNGY